MMPTERMMRFAPSTIDINELPKSIFDNLPEFYKETLNWPYRKHLEIPTIKNILGDISDSSLLDFGCGPGVLSRQFKQMGAQQVVGYDISQGMLNFAQQTEQDSPLGITYLSNITSDYNQYFDIIVSIYTMSFNSHYSELQAMINKMSSLLKPQGKLITVVINPSFCGDIGFYQPYNLKLTDILPRSDGSTIELNIFHSDYDITFPVYNWTIETLNILLKQGGFHNISLNGLVSPPSEYTSELADYISCPHAKIITANKI